MATQRTRETLRFRYGRCLNDECENCKSKKIIEVPARKDFVCPDCGKELHECPPPKKKSNSGLIGGIIGAVVLIIVGICYFLLNDDNRETQERNKIDTELQAEETVVATDSIVAITEEVSAPVSEPAPEVKAEEKLKTTAPSSTQSSRNKDLGYATWKGALKNGQPNDENGTMTYKENHRIDSRDPQARVAEPGDYIIGEYVDGKLVQGIWYDKNNTVKGSIIIGR